jgi:hypothetical protein
MPQKQPSMQQKRPKPRFLPAFMPFAYELIATCLLTGGRPAEVSAWKSMM